MSVSSLAQTLSDEHLPIDLVEQVVLTHDWPYDRPDMHELVTEVPMQWNDIRVWCSWRPELDALLFSFTYSTKAPQRCYPELYALIAQVNERMVIGHFDLSHEEGLLGFRHTFLLTRPDSLHEDAIESLLERALAECERFYPAFQSLVWGGKSAKESLEIALFETLGEA